MLWCLSKTIKCAEDASPFFRWLENQLPLSSLCTCFSRTAPTSNGDQFLLFNSDHFTNWYEAIPLQDQQALTTANAFLEHWIWRFICPYSIRTEQRPDFESKLSQQLMRLLQIDKTRTNFFHPQSNLVEEGLNRTLLNELTKSIVREQAQWSQFL